METKRDWREDGKRASANFLALVELTTEASANVAYAAAKKGSADVKDIAKEADELFTALAAISAAGLTILAALVQTRLENDKLRAQVAGAKEVEELDAQKVTDDIVSAASAFINRVAAKKE